MAETKSDIKIVHTEVIDFLVKRLGSSSLIPITSKVSTEPNNMGEYLKGVFPFRRFDPSVFKDDFENQFCARCPYYKAKTYGGCDGPQVVRRKWKKIDFLVSRYMVADPRLPISSLAEFFDVPCQRRTLE